MKLLKDILYNVSIKNIIGSTDIDVDALFLNSLDVKSKGFFIAIKGFTTDGHKYISSAIENGATAILCQELPTEIKEGVTYIEATDTAIALAVVSSNFYENPSSNIKLVKLIQLILRII